MMLPVSSLPEAQGVSRGEEGAGPLEQHVSRWLVRGILCSAFTMILLACGYGSGATGERQVAGIILCLEGGAFSSEPLHRFALPGHPSM